MWLIGILIGIIVMLFVILYTARTQRQTRVSFANSPGLEDIYPTLENLAQAPFVDGNTVEVLQNGDGFFPVLLKEFEAAEHFIHFQTYAWWKGDICQKVAQTLAKKAQEGVEVRVMLDALGSLMSDKKHLKLMRDAGCHVEKYHPFEFKTIGRINKRNHRKSAVVDAKVAFVMAHGVAKEWEGNGDGPKSWRDTGVRLTGPIINHVHAAFATDWMEQTGHGLVGENYFPVADELPGDIRCQLVASSPRGGVSHVSIMLRLMIGSADKEIIIQNPYFCPDPNWIHDLGKAVDRGVDVHVMMPGRHNDSKAILWAGRHEYQTMLDHGLKVYIYQPTLIHQKIMIVDQLWSHVGSTNFDERSLDINAEISLGIHDERIAAELREAFFNDMEKAEPLDEERWKNRPLYHRVMEWAWFRVHEQL